ncbi:MAG TPA: DUF2914 domain-containing protein [Candidatus Krumholzibacterium sp.]|nr:DUF2914 domain-containing protein [Candidatus Krumholzibacterium sp.]
MPKKIGSTAIILIAAVSSIILSAAAIAGEDPAGASIEKAVICTSIEDRAPVGINTQFFEQVDRLYCYTRVTGCTPPDSIAHVWYYDGQEKARVMLPVRSASWRTWSSKTILPGWSGAWRVEILSGRGDLLHTVQFVYKPVGDQSHGPADGTRDESSEN